MNRQDSIDSAVHTIVVPIDFSPTARLGLERAAQVAREHGSRVILVHVLVLHEGAEEPSREASWNSEEELVPRITRKLDDLAREVLGPKIPHEVVVLRDADATGAVAAYADSVAADVIIAGTHGTDHARRPMKELFSRELSHRARRAVIAVPPARRSSRVQ